MKIYTKKGDLGDTSLFGGQRVKKSHARINAYGTVDELNSILGMARASQPAAEVDQLLHNLQIKLFEVGADLATPPSKKAKIARISESDVQEIEQTIDYLDDQLPALTRFILPSGSPSAAALHLARTVCRRAERLVVEAIEHEELNPFVIQYLNRLSDFLFVLSRFENKCKNVTEHSWDPS